MEYAIRIIKSLNGRIIEEPLVTIRERLSLERLSLDALTVEDLLVTIKDMELLERAIARSYEYKCPDENCARALRPVFPEKIRADGKEVHTPHFRATPDPHIEGCQKDGAGKRILERQRSSRLTKSPIFEVVKRTDFPVGFNEYQEVKHVVTDGIPLTVNIVNEVKQKSSQPRGGEGEAVKYQRHQSKSTSKYVRKFAEAFENHPLPLSQMPIAIEGCPAKTYAETFINVSRAVDSHGRIAARHIYRGSYKEYTQHRSGISIYFVERSVNGKKFSVWIGNEHGPAPIRQELFRRLEQAYIEGHAIIYVVGRFEQWKALKYTIEVEALSEVWISLPSDPSRRSSTAITETQLLCLDKPGD